MTSAAFVIDVHPAMFRGHPFLFALSVLLIAAFGLGLIILLIWYARTRSIRLSVDGERMHLETGLMSKSHVEVDISQIRTVKVHQTFWNRVFRVGQLSVYTAGDNPEFEVAGIPDPNRIREHVRNQREVLA